MPRSWHSSLSLTFRESATFFERFPVRDSTGPVGSQLFLHVLDRGDLSVCLCKHVHDCSSVCCCTRWICCSRAAARSACVLPEFVQSRLQLVRVFASSWRCPTQPSPGEVRPIWARDRFSQCAGPVGAQRSAALLNPKRLSCMTTDMSVGCSCGTSTVFWIFWMSSTVSASRVLNSLRDPLKGRHLSLCSDNGGLLDGLQLLGFQALSAPSAPVVSQRLVCHNCCSKAASVESPRCLVDT